MKLIRQEISIAEIRNISGQKPLKAVVDIDQSIIVIDIPDYITGELYMLEECDSSQGNLWGIQLHPERYDRADWIAFEATMNARPSGNTTNYIADSSIRERIKVILAQVVHD